MKKLIVFVVLIAFVACMATAAMAQNNPLQKGAKALSGFIGNFNSSKLDKGDTSTSYNLGGSFEYFVTDNGAIRLGVGFFNGDSGNILAGFDQIKGTELKGKTNGSFLSIGYRHNFRQFEAPTFPYARLGYGFGSMKSDVNVKASGIGTASGSFKQELNGFELGVGVEHLMGNTAIFGEIVYSPLSCKTTLDGNLSGYGSGSTSTSSTLTKIDLNLGLRFYF